MNIAENINMDAWASGQVSSKLWLNQMAEEYLPNENWNICILGGWYGLLSFLLFSRNKLSIANITNIDIDEKACQISNFINDMWIYKNKYKSIVADINSFNFEDFQTKDSLFINTSTEHMTSNQWWENIPKNAWVIMQSTDMKHEEHVNTVSSIGQFKYKYSMSDYIYCDSHFIDYKNENSFTRYMIIGKK